MIKEYHNKKIPIIDYSIENIEHMKLDNHYFVPFQYINDSSEMLVKEQDVCMIYFNDRSINRKNIRDSIPNINIIKGYGEDRDNILFNHKILVNIHFNDTEYKIHEHMRCDRCVYSKMIVVSEPSIYDEKLPLRKYMIIENRENIPNRVQDILENYEKYYNELFNGVDFNELQKENESLFINAIQSIYKYHTNIYNIGITLKLPDISNTFTNGIWQNSITMFNLLKMCKNVNDVYIITDNVQVIPKEFEYLKNNIISFETSIQLIDVLVMSALKLDESNIKILRDNGIKVVCQILGSSYHILNENIVFGAHDNNTSYNNIEIDQVWISPHLYKLNKDFAEIIYNSEAKICPYVWSPFFINETCKMINKDIYKPNNKYKKRISVFEPNINYVKSCLKPIIFSEKFFRKYSDYLDKINIFCSEELNSRNSFINFVSGLTLQKNYKLFFEKRYPIVYSLFEHTDIVFTHQSELEYNYLYFDVAWLGYPLLHNSESLKELGYYYYNCDTAIERLKYICENFDNEHAEYILKSRNYISKFLYDNPDNIKEYEKLIDNLFK